MVLYKMPNLLLFIIIFEGRIVFSLCPFSDESADMYQSWCQSVEQFDSFPRHLNLWPPKTPQNAPRYIVGRLVFMSIHKWIRRREPKLVLIGPAVWSFSRLLNVWPPKTPTCPPCVSSGNLFGVYPFPDEYAHVCQMWCQSVQSFDSFNILLNLWPPKTHKMPPGILRENCI